MYLVKASPVTEFILV